MKKQYIYIDERGNKFYYSDKSMTARHREDGPAVEWANGAKAWFINGKRHREDGPAIEDADGFKAWFINGEESAPLPLLTRTFAEKLGRERNEAMKELRDLVEACDEFGGGASISHPRYTQQRAAARSFLENAKADS